MNALQMPNNAKWELIEVVVQSEVLQKCKTKEDPLLKPRQCFQGFTSLTLTNKNNVEYNEKGIGQLIFFPQKMNCF